MAKNKSAQNTYTTDCGSNRAGGTTNSTKDKNAQDKTQNKAQNSAESKNSASDCNY